MANNSNNQQSALTQPSTEDKKYPFFYFTTVNRRVNPYDVQDMELYDSVNWWTEYQMYGKKVRPGYTVYLDRIDTKPVTGLFYTKFQNGQKRLARVSGKYVYAVDPNVAGSWSTPDITLVSGNDFVRPDFTMLQAIGHIVSQISSTESHYIEWTNSLGSDSMTDTNYTSGGGDVVVPYKAKTCVQYHRRVYVGSPYDASGLYGSNLNFSGIDYAIVGGETLTPWSTFANDISTANIQPIDADYKGVINKLTVTSDKLNIYKEGGIYSFNESSVFEIFGLSPYQGSIANMDENQTDYFFTNEGFFSNNGQTVRPIGEGWYPIIKEILTNGITPSSICSLAVNFLYFCFMGTITYGGKTINNAMFVYNAYFDELYLWSMGHQITALGYFVDNSGNKQVVMGDVNGFTYKLDYSANSDAGIPIEARFRTKYFWFDEPDKKNQLSGIWGFADPFGGELEISVDKDYQNEFKYPVLSVSGIISKKKKDPSYIGAFNMLSLEVYWNGKGTRPGFYGVILNIKQDSERIIGRRQDAVTR